MLDNARHLFRLASWIESGIHDAEAPSLGGEKKGLSVNAQVSKNLIPQN